MLNNIARFPATRVRLAITLALSIILPLITACNVHNPVAVEKLLTPLSQADTAQLIRVVNSLTAARSIRGRVDIQFEDTSFAPESRKNIALLTDRLPCSVRARSISWFRRRLFLRMWPR